MWILLNYFSEIAVNIIAFVPKLLLNELNKKWFIQYEIDKRTATFI